MANLLDQTSYSGVLPTAGVRTAPSGFRRLGQVSPKPAPNRVPGLIQPLMRSFALSDPTGPQSANLGCFFDSGIRTRSHFAEFSELAWDSHPTLPQALEQQPWATRQLQVATGVANCNTYNRNQPVRELGKGGFFHGRGHDAGIDSRTESFRTAFQTIHKLIRTHASEILRMLTDWSSDDPRHAPSVQC